MQPWPAEVLEERAGDVALAFASLLSRHAAWRHRRVETIAVLSHEGARRTVSIDFTVPAEHREELRLSDNEWVVPLALLVKRPLVHFDLRDEAAESVPLLRAEETQVIGRELLYLALDLDLAESGGEQVGAGSLIERVLAVAPPSRDELAEMDAALAALEERAGPLPGFADLAERLARGFLLCAVLDDVARRRVVKFAYDEPTGRRSRLNRGYDASGATQVASFHVEIAVPDELRARTTELVDDATREVIAAAPRDSDRPALYLASTPARRATSLEVRYGTERGRFLVAGALVAWVIALQLALPWLFADLSALATQAGPAIAILLSSSVVFSALVLRAGEHPLVRYVLAPYRLCLAGATIAAAAAGSALGFHAADAVLRWVWGLGALAAAAAAGILTVHAVRAPSARSRPTV